MLQRLRRSEAPRRFLALVMAYLTVLGTMPAYANSSFSRTATPIKHLVVIFQENVSFDHYFGTYPNAAQSQRRAGVLCAAGHSDGQRAVRERC